MNILLKSLFFASDILMTIIINHHLYQCFPPPYASSTLLSAESSSSMSCCSSLCVDPTYPSSSTPSSNNSNSWIPSSRSSRPPHQALSGTSTTKYYPFNTWLILFYRKASPFLTPSWSAFLFKTTLSSWIRSYKSSKLSLLLRLPR